MLNTHVIVSKVDINMLRQIVMGIRKRNCTPSCENKNDLRYRYTDLSLVTLMEPFVVESLFWLIETTLEGCVCQITRLGSLLLGKSSLVDKSQNFTMVLLSCWWRGTLLILGPRLPS